MDLCELPFPVLRCIIENSVIAVGLYKAVRLRMVCKIFDGEVSRAVFETRIFDFDDELRTRDYSREDPRPQHVGAKDVSRRLKIMIRKPHAFPYNDITNAIQQHAQLFAGENHTHERYIEYANVLCDTVAMNLSPRSKQKLLRCGESSSTKESRTSPGMRQSDPDIEYLRDRIAAASSLKLEDEVLKLLDQVDAEDLISHLFGHPLVIAARSEDLHFLDRLLNKCQLGRSKRDALRPIYHTAAAAASSAGRASNLWRILAYRTFDQKDLEFYAQAAAKTGKLGVIEWIHQYQYKENRIKSNRRAIQTASQYGHIKLVRKLLDSGVHINAAGSKENALHCAARGGHARVARLLLERGIRYDQQFDGNPLFLAAGNGHEDVFQVLIDYGANLQAHDLDERLFNLAARNGEASMLRFLVKHGVNVQKPNVGEKALMLAAGHGQEESIKYIASLGVPLNAEGLDTSINAMLVAWSLGRDQIVQLLLDLGADEMDLTSDDQ